MRVTLPPLSQTLTSIWYGESAARWVLWPAAAAYRSLVRLRREAYRRELLKTVELPVPVIVIGNVSVGGTGKTPFVIWLADQLRQRNLRVGIVTRGYGGNATDWPRVVTAESDPSEVGDEPVLLARRTSCPVVAGPDRVAAAQRLLAEQSVDVLLSDDGLQHYRLARRFEIAVVDGERGMGNGLCLPAGPLREPAERLSEVDAIVVNGGKWGHAGVFRAQAVVTSVYRVKDREPRALESFKRGPVHAVAGIGNPQRFFDLLENAGLDVVPHPLEDHARLGPEQLNFVEPYGPVLITEKDAVKCESFAHEDVWCVAVDLHFDADKTARLMRLVQRDLRGPSA
jgi:tetraacyldisaccharide 4'-kinase